MDGRLGHGMGLQEEELLQDCIDQFFLHLPVPAVDLPFALVAPLVARIECFRFRARGMDGAPFEQIDPSAFVLDPTRLDIRQLAQMCVHIFQDVQGSIHVFGFQAGSHKRPEGAEVGLETLIQFRMGGRRWGGRLMEMLGEKGVEDYGDQFRRTDGEE